MHATPPQNWSCSPVVLVELKMQVLPTGIRKQGILCDHIFFISILDVGSELLDVHQRVAILLLASVHHARNPMFRRILFAPDERSMVVE